MINLNKIGKVKLSLIALIVLIVVLISFNTNAINQSENSSLDDILAENNVSEINQTEINITEINITETLNETELERPLIKEEKPIEEPTLMLQGGNEDIGYETIDNETFHLWNNLNHYYFDIDSGIQVTNHYSEYWTKNIFCLGYKTSSWNYLCNDQLNNFNWNIETDNETYVEIIGHKDTTIQGYDVRLALRYYLEINDEDLTIQPFIKNLDDSNINNDLRFVWRIEDIQIAGEEDNNVIVVGEQYTHNLSDSIDQTYSSLSVGSYIINRDSEWLRLKWDSSLNDAVQIKSEVNQYNSPVSLAITTNGLNSGQNKTTTFYWIDATCSLNWKDTTPSDNAKLYDNNATHVVGGCLEPEQCPLSQNCIETVKVQERKEGATGWSILNSKDYEFALCETPEYTTNTYTFKHNNKTDIRIGYFVPTWDAEFGCAQPGNPYASEIRNDIWLNNNTPTAENVSITPSNPSEDDYLTCNYDFQDLDNDGENTNLTEFNWYKNNVAQNINSQVLERTYTSSGESWKCSVKVFDNVFSTGNEIQVNSSEVTINGSIVRNESLAREAIEEGINNAITPNQILTDQLIYTRNSNNIQNPSSYFDKVAFLNNQRWAFNYLTDSNLMLNPGFEEDNFQYAHFIGPTPKQFEGLADIWAITPDSQNGNNYAARITSDKYDGTYSMLVNDSQIGAPMAITYLLPAVQNINYTCSAYAKILASNPQIGITANWGDGLQDIAMYFFNSTKGRVDSDYGNYCSSSEICETVNETSWKRYSLTRTAPTGTSYVSCFVNSFGNDSAVVLWDAFQIVEGSLVDYGSEQGTNHTTLGNNTVNFWQNSSLTYSEIVSQVQGLIVSTQE